MLRFDMRWGLALAVMALGMAADASAQQLLETDGIELLGEAQLVMSGGGTCNVLESDTAYEARQGNDGAPMDIWQLDFSVRNGSGRWLDHLIARFQIESEWPECTNWDGPGRRHVSTSGVGRLDRPYTGKWPQCSVARSDADRNQVLHRPARRSPAAIRELVGGFRLCPQSTAGGHRGDLVGGICRRAATSGGHPRAGDCVLAVDRGQHEPDDVRGLYGAVPGRGVSRAGRSPAGGVTRAGGQSTRGGQRFARRPEWAGSPPRQRMRRYGPGN